MNFLHNRATGALCRDGSHRSPRSTTCTPRTSRPISSTGCVRCTTGPCRAGSAIEAGTRFGNTRAVVSAADSLAGAGGQLGDDDVAEVCRAIAADARRGVLAHARVEELRALARD